MSSGPSTLIKDHLAGGASRLAALLLPQILPVFSVVAPCHPGAALRDLVLDHRGRATSGVGDSRLRMGRPCGDTVSDTMTALIDRRRFLLSVPALAPAPTAFAQPRAAAPLVITAFNHVSLNATDLDQSVHSHPARSSMSVAS